MANPSLPAKQFTKVLRDLPDGILQEMIDALKRVGLEPLQKPHSRGRMIKYIVQNREKLAVNKVENPDDIEDRKQQVTGFTILMRIIINICGNHCTKYTVGTLQLFIHMFYGIDIEEKSVLFKKGFADNLFEFSKIVSEERDEFNNVYKFKDKFKELVFDTIDTDIVIRLYSQAAILAGTYSYHKDGHDLRHQKFVGHNPEHLIVYSLCNVNLDGYDDSFDYAPDVNEAPSTLPNFINASDVSTPAPSPAASPTPTPPAPVAPAPVAPLTPTPAFTGSEPIVKIVTDPAEYEKILEGIGNLMNPGNYQELSKHKISKHSWNKLRKKHNLKGRWDIYVETAEILGDKPRQNKNLKYQNPRHTLPGWEGVWNCNETGTPVSNHPYGTIYLVDPKMDLPPPS